MGIPRNGHAPTPGQRFTPTPPVPAQAPVVPLAPVPSVVTVGQTETADGKTWVVLTHSTPLGTSSHFLEGPAAVTIGEALAKLGRAAGAGLTLPGN